MNTDFKQFLEKLDQIIEKLNNELKSFPNNDDKNFNDFLKQFISELQLVSKINLSNKSKKQRSRLIRKYNIQLSKRLANFSQINSNQERNNFYEKFHNDWKLMKEQEEIDRLDLNDASLLLKEHDKKKDLLISELEKLTSIVNYRKLLKHNLNNKAISNDNEDDFEVNIKKLKELLSRKIRRINREQTVIKNLFNFDQLKSKRANINNNELVDGMKEMGKIRNNYLSVNISKYLKNYSLSNIGQDSIGPS